MFTFEPSAFRKKVAYLKFKTNLLLTDDWPMWAHQTWSSWVHTSLRSLGKVKETSQIINHSALHCPGGMCWNLIRWCNMSPWKLLNCENPLPVESKTADGAQMAIISQCIVPFRWNLVAYVSALRVRRPGFVTKVEKNSHDRQTEVTVHCNLFLVYLFVFNSLFDPSWIKVW